MFLVFKTTVNSPQEAVRLQPHLDALLYPAKWNFDLSDCDRILRVEGQQHISPLVIDTVRKLGFECVELD